MQNTKYIIINVKDIMTQTNVCSRVNVESNIKCIETSFLLSRAKLVIILIISQISKKIRIIFGNINNLLTHHIIFIPAAT